MPLLLFKAPCPNETLSLISGDNCPDTTLLIFMINLVLSVVPKKLVTADVAALPVVAHPLSTLALLLKVFQSVLDKKPFCMPLACLTSMVDPVPNTAPVPPVIVNIEDPVSDKLLMERSRGTPADPVLFPLTVLAGMSDNLAFVTAASV